MQQNPYESPQWPADLPGVDSQAGELEPIEWIMFAVGFGGAILAVIATVLGVSG